MTLGVSNYYLAPLCLFDDPKGNVAANTRACARIRATAHDHISSPLTSLHHFVAYLLASQQALATGSPIRYKMVKNPALYWWQSCL